MVIVTLYKNGAEIKGHCQNSKACRSLTVVFYIFKELIPNLIIHEDFKLNSFLFTTNDQKYVDIIHKYLKELSLTWTKNEIFLLQKF
jgi:hypothetical protein